MDDPHEQIEQKTRERRAAAEERMDAAKGRQKTADRRAAELRSGNEQHGGNDLERHRADAERHAAERHAADAREHAREAHERAASTHDSAATLAESRGDADGAAEHRKSAEKDRQNAADEIAPNAPDDAENR